jgi:hypothetical protein
MDLLAAIQAIPGVGPYLPWVMLIVTLASILAPIVPPSWGPVYRIINIIAANVGQARNATDPKVNK